jgi:poly(beta-D-mannuronate) lyase
VLLCPVSLLRRGSAHACRRTLVSPWDTHPIRSTKAPYDCPEPTVLPVDFVTDGFYALNDPTHSIIDALRQREYDRTSGPVKREGNQIVEAADNFRVTGSEAVCVIHHMEVEAKAHALTGKMSSSQAYFVQDGSQAPRLSHT